MIKATTITLLIIFFAVFLSIAGAFLGIITIPFLKFNRQVQMNRDIVTKTYTAENALYNYHWFKERFEAIKATEKKIENSMAEQSNFRTSAGDRKNWTFEDKNEDARLSSITLGLKNHYEDIVAEYNARSKQADKALFKDELPLFINLNTY